MTLFIASVPPLCVIAMLANTYSPQQPNEPARSGVGICQREGKRLVGVQPIAARGKIGLPKKTKNVRPRYPAFTTWNQTKGPRGLDRRGIGRLGRQGREGLDSSRTGADAPIPGVHGRHHRGHSAVGV